MPDLKVGTTVDIVFENEINKSNAHHMKALVYDYEGSKITISQTSPALNRHFLNRRIMVTFLDNADGRVLRFGFAARLMDLITNYEIASSKNVEALVLKQFEKPYQVDFRMYFRIKPPSSSDINLFFQEEKVNLIDISLGGAKFTYPMTYTLSSGAEIKVKLVINSKEFEVKARLRNIQPPHEFSINKALQYACVEFEYDNRQLGTVLGRAIIEIERKMLSEGRL